MLQLLLFVLPLVSGRTMQKSIFEINALNQEKVSLGTLHIKDFVLTRCQNTSGDAITLEDVSVDISDKAKLTFSGTFSTTVDLNSNIQASVFLERKIVFWIEVPCENNKGSCTYDDLCSYGIPNNRTCPNVFIENKVPCRCPIKKGTYVIPKSFGISSSTSVYSGRYKGTVTLSSKEYDRLACYDTSFTLYDKTLKSMYYYLD